MSEIVPSSAIERIVGTNRHPEAHYGRAVSTEQMVYILHSQTCKDSGIDLRECPFSVALDRGIDEWVWSDDMDRPVELVIFKGHLVPRIDGPS